ncbi:MAG: ATP-binding cassette domain-containing protein [Clostridium sp.]|nr:ATP-binding cassette domain-containing protein [Clostridium sp.]MCM1398376.1 ATP-binding cassette domain-containing protein [Clostridium sp.]MCM1458959.1 ATP-binding cassette domain-containing protein [Bacteroides sp.]
MPEIELLHISKSFQTKEGSVQALKDVNLSIETGDIYGIIGMSGAGKSTLVRCMNYLEIPSEGVVKLQGEELAKLSDRQLRKKREKAGMIFQHFNLLMQKNVLSNICFPLLIQGTSKGDSEKRAMELLEMVGMTDKAKAFPSQLSGGQKQRVAIARALASEPKILLCDEATSALDPQTTSAILELLKKINRELGITIVVITHQMSVVRQICNKVAIMKEGQIVETGNTLDIFSHPKSEVARELLRTDVDVQAEKKVLWEVDNIKGGSRLRIVYSANSAFEPVIANMILKFNEPVNILKAATRNVGGVAKGEMILELLKTSEKKNEMITYLKERNIEIEELDGREEV